MSKRRFVKLIVLLFLIVVSNILVFNYCNLISKDITLSYEIISDKDDTYQLFYTNDKTWSEEKSQKIIYNGMNKSEKLEYKVSEDTVNLRFDLGNKPSKISISDIKLSYLGKYVLLDNNQFLNEDNQAEIDNIEVSENYMDIKTIGEDPYITYKLESNAIVTLLERKNMLNNALKIVVCIIINIFLMLFMKNLKSIIMSILEVENSKSLIWNLSKNDFKTKYAGSYLGIFWAFIQPVITVLTYWFVFQVGFRSQPMDNFPFLLWLVVGLVPWFFFAEAIINATNSMLEYSYLVKKVVFKISVLPVVKIISAFFVHIFFIAFTIILFSIYGYYPNMYMIQIVYYTLCTVVLVLGISYATSAVIVFFKDLGQIVAIVLQIGIWLTPIMWNDNIIPSKYQWIFKLNPMYYVVQGYRDSFINHMWVWERLNQTIYFWVISIGLFIIGTIVFRKLKGHFADVL